MAVKVQSLIEYEQNDEIEVLLFADTKEEVSDDMEIDGIPKGKVISYGSSLITADGDIAFLKSDGTWNFVGNGGSDPNLEVKSVEPDFSDGDVLVEPSEGYDGLSSVTIEKDSDLVASNIKKDVEVFGITGTLEASGTYNVEFSYPDGVLPDYANDTNLVSIKIPKTVGTMTGNFYECTSLKSAVFEAPSLITALPLDCFSECTSLERVELPNNLVSIDECAFYGCTSLTSVEFPSGFTSIGDYAFQGCTLLNSVSLPDTTTTLGAGCFENIALEQIVLPELVTYLADTFYGCASLSTVVCKAPQLVEAQTIDVFTETQFDSTGTGGTLYVPQALISSYQADATWSAILSANPNNQILPIEGSIYE